MEPINYNSYLPNPLGFATNFLTGLQLGDMLKQRQLQEEQQKIYRTDLENLSKNPTPDAIMQMMRIHPEQSAKFKPMLDAMSEEQKKNQLSSGGQIFSALASDNPDLAKKLVADRISAYENSGMDTSNLKQISSLLETDPKAAQAFVGITLASIDPKFAENYSHLGEEIRKQALQPYELKEKKAKAGTAESEQAIKGIEAKYIEPKTLQAIQKTNLDMKKILADIDIARQNSRIAAMNAQTNRETNSLKRQELGIKVAEAQNKLNDSIREKVASADSAISTSDNILNSIDRILAVPKGVRESAHGPISSMIKTVRSDTADYEALLDTLGSQSFLAQISSMKGMGALSDAEGKKLQAGMQNLSLSQSAEQAEKNVREMKKLMLKARKNIEVKYGIESKPPESSFMSDENAKSVFDKYGIK